MRRREDEMTASGGDSGDEVGRFTPHPSPRVRLEVAALEGDDGVPIGAAPPAADEHRRQTVLVVAGDADFRRYVLECLRVRADLRPIGAATVGVAQQLAAQDAPVLIIVDERAAEVIVARVECRGIVLVDDVPREDASYGGRVRSSRARSLLVNSSRR